MRLSSQVRTGSCTPVSFRVSWRRPRFLLTLMLTVFALLAPCAHRAAAAANGLQLENYPAGDQPPTVSGTIRIDGVADHPAFRKWQLDLLLDGVDATFLALGEEPHPQPGLLAEVDTTRYPDGDHRLRLRVVHNNLNYDEYFLAVTFANAAPPPADIVPAQPSPTPATPDPPAPAGQSNGLVLTSTTLHGTVTIRGVADHPAFRKWQLDLLLDGDPDRATYLGLGEEPVATAGDLITLDTTRYPNGDHRLRLRVVHSNLNYDEYMAPVTIANTGTSATGPGGDVVRRGETGGERVIYLTFDDGPHLPYTQQVLDLLAQYNAKATFFVVGRNAQSHPELIRTAYEAGHGIGNHTWSHRSLAGVNQATFQQEIQDTADVLGGYAAACLRPPYGATAAATYTYASDLGMPVVLWSIDTWDWKRPHAATIASTVLKQAYPGAIVLMHDGGGNRVQTVAALEIILRELSAQGYTFKAYCR